MGSACRIQLWLQQKEGKWHAHVQNSLESESTFEALQNNTHSEMKSEEKWTAGTEQFSQLSSETAPYPWHFQDEASTLPSNLTPLSEQGRAEPGSGGSNWKT